MNRHSLSLFALGSLVLGALPSCGGGPTAPPTTAIFDLPRGAPLADWYDLPYPNDLRVNPDGTTDITDYPQGNLSDVLPLLMQNTKGLSTNGAIFFRVDQPLDKATLPKTPADTVVSGASVFLVDIDPASPAIGERVPVKLKLDAIGGPFITAPDLGLLPYPGFPLRPLTKYAAVMTTGLHGLDGGPVLASPDFLAVMADTPTTDVAVMTARTVYAPLKAWLDSNKIPRSTVVDAAVFTTGDPVSLMQKARQVIYASVAAPTAAALAVKDAAPPGYTEYVGTYSPVPIFQSGTTPYNKPSLGGGIKVDASGTPILDHTMTLRFSISVPKATMPTAGWPIVLYAHGTGGDYESYVNDGTAAALAQVTDPTNGSSTGHFAVLAIDQVVHGPMRDPAGLSPDGLFFNVNNFVAARDNVRQGGIDYFQLVRLVQSFSYTMPDGALVKLDPNNVYYMGHSQGGLTGPGFLAFEPNVKAAILSGAGGNLIESLLTKTQPVDITQFVFVLLRDPNLDEFEPALSLLEAFIEPGDPTNYGRYIFREPPTGQSPKDVFQTEGFIDHYAPIQTIEAFGTSMGVQPFNPLIAPIAGTTLRGLAPLNPPVSNNLTIGGVPVTAVIGQYKAPPGDDGHFVIFDVPQATSAYTNFLASKVATGTATVPVEH